MQNRCGDAQREGIDRESVVATTDVRSVTLMEQQPWKVAVIVVVLALLVLVIVGFYREEREIRARLPRLRARHSADHPTGEATPSV